MAGPSSGFRVWGPRLAVALWAPSMALIVWSLWRSPADDAGGDARRAIRLTAEERDVVLEVMRANVVSIHGILAAQAAGDLGEVVRVASTAATAPGPVARFVSLKRKLPAEWREMGKQVDGSFAAIAEQARAGSSPGVTAELAANTGACVACHARFRLALEVD